MAFHADGTEWNAYSDVTELDADRMMLQDLARAVLARHGDDGWSLTETQGGFWCYLEPGGGERPQPVQGWKLHVSATPLSAPVVLSRAAEILVRAGCPFKFAATLETVASLVSAEYDRGGGGKFITAYPVDDDQFQAVAGDLDEATAGLPGPTIMSDRPLRPGSLVHYRYGVFSGTGVFTNDASYENRLVAPDGRLVPDQRLGWFSPPDWAPPAPVAERVGMDAGAGTPVLLDDRYVVSTAIRLSIRGGVYRAEDRHTGAGVVIKQARPHTAVTFGGFDARDRLRREERSLRLLARTRLTPEPIGLFEQQGDLFLVLEQIEGVPLRTWADRVDRDAEGAARRIYEVVTELVALLAELHGHGLVVRDFTPNNVMVQPDGRLRLVDLEAAVRPGAAVAREYTLGYVAPEYEDSPRLGFAPDQTTDLYSLGATVFFTACALHPLLLPDDAAGGRSRGDRLGAWVDAMAADNTVLRTLAPLILGLMADEPADRWSLAAARAFLAELPVALPMRTGTRPALRVDDRDRLTRDGLRYVLSTMDEQAPRLWRASGFGETSDRCNVQYGAAGVLAVLTRAATAGRSVPGGPSREDLLDAVRRTAAWLEDAWPAEPTILPGLHFGRSGTAWALFDAAHALGDQAMARRASDLALRVPVTWPNPDVCHGMAGAGMLQLYLWQVTGDRRFAERAVRCADALHLAADRTEDRVLWPIPEDFDSQLAGLVHFGFAHGVAGVGSFLLATGVALGRGADVELADLAGRTLADVAVPLDDGTAVWPSGEKDGPPMVHWCSGSSGVGTFLIRLWAVTGRDRYRELAELAAAAVWRTRWYCTPAACHGLAGNAQFLLDLADLLNEDRYRTWAEDLVVCAHTRALVRDGCLVVPNESLADVTVDYQTGLTGFLDLLLRLGDGGRRLWMPELQHPAAFWTGAIRPAALAS
ncbi:MAG: hypothetical protein AUG49_18070 [Catenulispora sp. 13_1_20CM_3_70_7]|nr:MAG: hypothetical protein AUG49_18070 [Catenulispora sp. 13_1_20CM_3_70_7]